MSVACGDFQAALLGAGLMPNELSINVGTGAQVATMSDHFRVATCELRPFGGGDYVLCKTGLPGGRCIELFAKFLGEATQLCGVPVDTTAILAALEAASGSADQSTMECLPFFYDADRVADAGFRGVAAHDFRPQVLYQSLLRGIAKSCAEASLDLAAHVATWNALRLSGGALRRGAGLSRHVVAQFGLPVRLSTVDEEAALGACIVAMATL